MPDPVNEQVISTILAAFDAIYSNELPKDDKSLPVTVVAEGDEIASQEVHGRTDIELPINIGSGVKSDSTDPDEQRKVCKQLLASVQQTMITTPSILAVVDSVEYTGGAVAIEPGRRCMIEAIFTVRFHYNADNPYSID